jgi:hypothetical protein
MSDEFELMFTFQREETALIAEALLLAGRPQDIPRFLRSGHGSEAVKRQLMGEAAPSKASRTEPPRPGASRAAFDGLEYQRLSEAAKARFAASAARARR